MKPRRMNPAKIHEVDKVIQSQFAKLDTLKFDSMHTFGGYALHSAQLDKIQSELDIVYRLSVELVNEVLNPTNDHIINLKYEYSKPTSWWQHFKESHFPGWLKIIFPVRYKRYKHTVEKKIHVDVKAAYPKFNTIFPPNERPYVIYTFVSEESISTGKCEIEIEEIE